MTDPRSHAHHDRQLIAAHAAGDLTGSEHDQAARRIAECPDCAVLHDDLLVLARAIHDLPAPARRRDFRLSPETAAGLRRSGWRRLVAAFAGPRFAVARPLGATLATLGLAGLLLAAIPGVSIVGIPSTPLGPASEDHSAAIGYGTAGPTAAPGTPGEIGSETERAHTASPQPLGVPGVSTFGTQGNTGNDGESGPAGGATGTESGGVVTTRDATAAQRDAHSALAIMSGSFVILGVALVALRWTARRLGD